VEKMVEHDEMGISHGTFDVLVAPEAPALAAPAGLGPGW